MHEGGNDGEECGTLSLSDRLGQLRGWNVPEKYVAYSQRTGNKAVCLCVSVCTSASPLLLLAFGYFFLSIFFQFESIHFCAFHVSQHSAVAPS